MAEPALALPPEESTWPAQGQWTWEDYLRLPDDGQRYEILRGALHVSPAPTARHQLVLSYLLDFLVPFVHQRRLGRLLLAPIDLVLPSLANPVQPDLAFFARGDEPDPNRHAVERVPRLVVEVLSPSTSRLDQHVKFGVYEDAGVEEYWILDPATRSAVVWSLDDGVYRELGRYAGDATLRSGVLDGLEIPLAELFAE